MNASSPDSTPRHPPMLSDELRRLGVHLGSKALQPASLRPERQGKLSIEMVLPGEVVSTPLGTCFVVETCYPMDHLHGGQPLSILPARERPSANLARLAGDVRLTGLDFTSAIFFDIETTGLGIGAGLHAFLVGFGTFEGDHFCLRQYFMRDFDEEDALLYLLNDQMERFGGWVSFNGRNFDLPVLQSRFIFGRRAMPLASAPHLDLLYPARRLWRKRLVSCRLSSLEAGVLDMPREGDVPGWLIPELYFDYVRSGQTEYMRQVFLHNALDILSLVTLTARADDLLSGPATAAPVHPADLYSLGTVYESLGQLADAQQAYEGALDGRLSPTLQPEALRRLSRLYKRTGQSERAAGIWRTLAETGEPDAYVELAKYCEHVQRDHRGAARLVGQALTLENLPSRGVCSAEALERRLARLKRKLGKGGLPMPHIESYAFGKIVIDAKEYTSDLLILPGAVRAGWRRKDGHKLRFDDLTEAVDAKPQVLIIGTGNVGLMKVPQKVLDRLAAQGIRTEVDKTAVACQRYNELAKTMQVAAALHLTC